MLYVNLPELHGSVNPNRICLLRFLIPCVSLLVFDTNVITKSYFQFSLERRESFKGEVLICYYLIVFRYFFFICFYDLLGNKIGGLPTEKVTCIESR